MVVRLPPTLPNAHPDRSLATYLTASNGPYVATSCVRSRSSTTLYVHDMSAASTCVHGKPQHTHRYPRLRSRFPMYLDASVTVMSSNSGSRCAVTWPSPAPTSSSFAVACHTPHVMEQRMALTVSQHTHRAFLSPVALRSGLWTVQTSGRLRHEVWIVGGKDGSQGPVHAARTVEDRVGVG